MGPLSRYTIPRETPSAGALNTRGWEKMAIFVLFSTDIVVYLGNGARIAESQAVLYVDSYGIKLALNLYLYIEKITNNEERINTRLARNPKVIETFCRLLQT